MLCDRLVIKDWQVYISFIKSITKATLVKIENHVLGK